MERTGGESFPYQSEQFTRIMALTIDIQGETEVRGLKENPQDSQNIYD